MRQGDTIVCLEVVHTKCYDTVLSVTNTYVMNVVEKDRSFEHPGQGEALRHYVRVREDSRKAIASQSS